MGPTLSPQEKRTMKRQMKLITELQKELDAERLRYRRMDHEFKQLIDRDYATIAKDMVSQFWLAQVNRVAAQCLKEGACVRLIPPTKADFDRATHQLTATLGAVTTLSVAS